MKRFSILFLSIFLLATSALAQAPRVDKIEPPSWWAQHTLNPVRVLVRGTNLRNAKVEPVGRSLKVSSVRINDRGNYLFFDLAIGDLAWHSSENKTGPQIHTINITTPAGKTSFPFEVRAPLGPKTKTQGVTNDDIIYLIMTDRFADGDQSNNKDVDRKNPRAWHGGDFRGIINRLDYLQELGITAIWLTPWYDNPDEPNRCDKPWCPYTNYHGYHPIDYYSVENHFGTMADLRELVQKARAKGIKVIQDQVANHVGVQHAWVKHPPLDNWFSPFTQNSFNNSVLLSPNSSQAERYNVLKGWFNEFLPDNNHYEPEVARYQIQNALWWIGMTGIDGIRQDTIQYMPREFIRDWSAAILKQYPKFYMVGEVMERDSAHTAFFQGGRTGWDGIDTRLPSVFDFKLWETSQQVFTGKQPARALRDVLKYDGLYPSIDNVTVLQNNHDTDRFMSLPGATLEGAMLHTAFILSTRGIPQLYYGEELAMPGGHDPDNRKDFPGGFPGDKRDAFTKAGRTADEQQMFEFVRTWIEIRRKSSALKSGKTIDLSYGDDLYGFARQLGDQTVIVGINNSNVGKSIEFPESVLRLKSRRTIYSPNGTGLVVNISNHSAVNGTVSLPFPPKSAAVYEVIADAR